MKAIRIQMDLVFQVPDEEAEEVYEHDLGFFYAMKESFEKWSEDEDEIRHPVRFDLRHDMGLVEGGDVLEKKSEEE